MNYVNSRAFPKVFSKNGPYTYQKTNDYKEKTGGK